MPKQLILAELGQLLRLTVEKGQNEIFYQFKKAKKESMVLCCDDDGKTIICFLRKPRKIGKISARKREQLDAAADMYSEWSKFEPGNVRSYSATSKKLKFAGYALDIAYRSDKWTGKNADYIHRFDGGPRVSMDDLDDPTFIRIAGGGIEVRKEITG